VGQQASPHPTWIPHAPHSTLPRQSSSFRRDKLHWGSSDFPVFKPVGFTGFYDDIWYDHAGYIMKFNTNDYSRMWSTYVSGQGKVNFNSIVISSSNKIFVGGSTSDPAYPFLQYPNLYYQNTLLGTNSGWGNQDACLLAFDPGLNLIYGTLFGGYQTNPYGELITDMALYNNELYITEYTTADGALGNKKFPLFKPNNYAYYEPNYLGGYQDAFVTMLCIDNINGVNEKTKISKQKLNVYPVPANEKLIVSFDFELKNSTNLKIYNTTGQVVKSFEINKQHLLNHIILDINDLETGFYFVQMNDDEILYAAKFVKL